MREVRYPDIDVQLVGRDSNAGAIISAVVDALKENGVSRDEITAFRVQCYSGDYNNILRTCMEWVNVS